MVLRRPAPCSRHGSLMMLRLRLGELHTTDRGRCRSSATCPTTSEHCHTALAQARKKQSLLCHICTTAALAPYVAALHGAVVVGVGISAQPP
jgi:hypothetical protein